MTCWKLNEEGRKLRDKIIKEVRDHEEATGDTLMMFITTEYDFLQEEQIDDRVHQFDTDHIDWAINHEDPQWKDRVRKNIEQSKRISEMDIEIRKKQLKYFDEKDC